MYRIIGADGGEYGPVSTDQIRQWVSQGRLGRTSKAQLEGTADWKMLSEFPEFAVALSMPVNPPAMAPTAPPKTSALAVTSLVLGILGFFTCGLTALFGLILGIVGLGKIRKSNGRLSGSGLAIGGICISGVMLLLIPVMAGLLLPALAKAKQRAQTINCVNNMKQLALAAKLYGTDNNDLFPPAATWSDALSKSAATNIFHCPLEPNQRCSYAFNKALDGKKQAEINPQTVLFFESDAGWNGSGGASAIAWRNHSVSRARGYNSHEGICVVALVDGSVQTVPYAKLNTLRWNP